MIRRLVGGAAVLAVILPQTSVYFEATMSRLMLLQVPLLILLGYLAGRRVPSGHRPAGNPAGVTGWIFFIGSVAFWMVPRSVDLVVESGGVAQAMHVNLLIAGALLARSVRTSPFVLRTALTIYLLAMCLAVGMVYARSTALICGAFDITQQWAFGRTLILAAAGVFLVFLVRTTALLWHRD